MKSSTEKHKILPGLTTFQSDWRRAVQEIDPLGLKEVALFPTILGLNERKELYRKLEHTGLERIPHVHLRHDMETWELAYLRERYKTEVFNIHPGIDMESFLNKNRKYLDRIYVENLEEIGEHFKKVLRLCAGLCLDTAHWESGVLSGWPGYGEFRQIARDTKIGCCHISAVREEFFTEMIEFIEDQRQVEMRQYSYHAYDKLSEFDYFKKYIKYLPEIISIELTNSLKEQIKVKDYLEKIINL